MKSPTPAEAQQKLVMWVLWGAFVVGCVVQFRILGAKQLPPPDGTSTWLVALAPVFISMVLRWNVIPRLRDRRQVLTMMIMGVALAEVSMFVGLFIFPAHQRELFLAALLGIAQHAPIYLARLFPPERPES